MLLIDLVCCYLKLNYVIDWLGRKFPWLWTKRLLTFFPHVKINKISLIFVFPNHNFSFHITNQKGKIITEKYCHWLIDCWQPGILLWQNTATIETKLSFSNSTTSFKLTCFRWTSYESDKTMRSESYTKVPDSYESYYEKNNYNK